MLVVAYFYSDWLLLAVLCLSRRAEVDPKETVAFMALGTVSASM